MTEQVTLMIHLTPAQRDQIEERARQLGYETPAAYLLALVTADAAAATDADQGPEMDDGMRK
jgi:hypothetical protein